MGKEENFREEKSITEEFRSVRESLIRDITKETERDMKATLREVEAKYLRQTAELYRLDMEALKKKKERARRRY